MFSILTRKLDKLDPNGSEMDEDFIEESAKLINFVLEGSLNFSFDNNLVTGRSKYFADTYSI